MVEPFRQCVACRQKRKKKDLLRIVRTPPGFIVFDPEQRESGRGVYLCSMEKCLLKSRNHDLIGRNFNMKISPNLYSQLLGAISPKGSNQFEKLLGFAARARKIIFGEDTIIRSTNKGRVQLVVLDPYCGPSTRKRVESFMQRAGIPLIYFNGEKSLDIVVGKANCRCVGITDPGFARSVLQLMNHGS